MTKTTEEIVRLLKKRVTRAHIIQSLMAGTYIFLVFLVMHSFQSRLVVASLGASAFIVFGFPAAQSSRPRFLIGGYFIGMIIGWLCCGLIALLREVEIFPFPVYIPVCALAVFLSMFLMTVLNFEHPPSAALAVAVTTDPNPIILGLAGLSCIILLCVLKYLLKKHLHNL